MHVFLDACTASFAASLLYWERKVARTLAGETATLGASGASTSPGGNCFSLTKLAVIEVGNLVVTSILLVCQIFVDSFTNQYVYVIPAWMLVTEAYAHFFAGRI